MAKLLILLNNYQQMNQAYMRLHVAPQRAELVVVTYRDNIGIENATAICYVYRAAGNCARARWRDKMADKANDTKVRQARRDWLDAQGNPVASGDEAKAVGFRYTHIPTAKRIDPNFDPETDAPPADAVFEMLTIPEPTKSMGAIFGLLTLTGNIVSTATNPKSKGDPDANPIPDVVARFEELANGTWTGERGAGGVRFDKAKLAEAIMKAKGETDPNPYLAKLESGEKVKQKGKAEISYGAYAMKNPEVLKHYNELTNADVVSVKDL